MSQQIASLKSTIASIEKDRNDLARFREYGPRLERIQNIVEEIGDFHKLPDVVKRELFEAVHFSQSPRSYQALHHVRTYPYLKSKID